MINFLEELFMVLVLIIGFIGLFFIFKSGYYVFAEIFTGDVNYLKSAMEYGIKGLVLLMICHISDSVIIKTITKGIEGQREKKI